MGKDFPLDLLSVYGEQSQTTQLQNQIEETLTNMVDGWFLLPWPYLVVLICVLFIVLFGPLAANIDIIALTVSGLLHELGLVLAAPSPDFRYSHYMVFCSLLSVLLLTRARMKKAGDDAFF